MAVCVRCGWMQRDCKCWMSRSVKAVEKHMHLVIVVFAVVWTGQSGAGVSSWTHRSIRRSPKLWEPMRYPGGQVQRPSYAYTKSVLKWRRCWNRACVCYGCWHGLSWWFRWFKRRCSCVLCDEFDGEGENDEEEPQPRVMNEESA